MPPLISPSQIPSPRDAPASESNLEDQSAETTAADESGDPEQNNASFALRHFADEKFVSELINDVLEISKDVVKTEKQTDRLKDILDHYQEQPQLIDAFLGNWVTILIGFVKQFAEDKTEVNRKAATLSLIVLRLLTKLRGYKVVIKFLPHHVGDVEQSLKLIEDSLAVETHVKDWEQQYMLLLWLSIAIQIPFDLKKLTDPADYGTERSIEQRILRVCKLFITVSEKTRDAAAYLLSRFVTRPDVLPRYGNDVVDFLLSTMESWNVQDQDAVRRPHILCGCLNAVSEMFKSGTRVQLSSLAHLCLPRLLSLDLLSSSYISVRKNFVKAIQRLGLTFLPARLQSWRYKRGFRSLEDNISIPAVSSGSGDVPDSLTKPAENGIQPIAEADDDLEVPEVLEQIIGLLLRGLNDADGVIRWSSAKGIGRLCERLPKEFSEDVQNGVLQLFSYERSENAWHGGCLALAELSRRGAMLPTRFSDVMPVVLKAILYEELRGTFSVGSQVRDAACYVYWAFARAYEPKELSEFVMDIARHLILTALFDRSVNCRRAASAAFQEHVGRQGSFPHGLDIIPILDFESLGRRTNTYLKLSPKIAAFPQYTMIVLDFLISHRLGHWDAQTRELAAKTLMLLASVAPDYVAQKVVPEVLSRVASSHMFTRHGAIIGLGCLCEGLHNCGHFDQVLSDKVESVILLMNPVEIFKGLGNELIREAVLDLIRRVSKAQLPFHGKSALLDQMAQLIEANLTLTDFRMQELAVSTLGSYLKTYGTAQSGVNNSGDTIQRRCFAILLNHLHSSSEITKRASVLGLSVFPEQFVEDNLNVIINAIVSTCPYSTHSEARWVDCRRNCCRSLEKLVEVISPIVFTADLFSKIMDFLCDCLSDYTEDKRGNVGRVVRLASLQTTKSVMLRIGTNHPDVLTTERIKKVVENLVRLFVEGIPDIRSLAGQTLRQLCSLTYMPEFSYKSNIRRCFEKFRIFVWLSGAETYPAAIQLLTIPELQPVIMLGLISSLGSLTESTVRDSSAAFRKYCRDLATDLPGMKSLAGNLTNAVTEATKEERLVLPTLNTIRQIFAGGTFCGNLDLQEPQMIIDLMDTVQHIRRSQSTPKVVVLIEIYAEALQFAEPVRGVALQRLLPFLSHVYPRVRVVAATKLHEGIIICDDLIEPADSDALSVILGETAWAFSLEKSQEALKEISRLMHIEVKPMQLKTKHPK